MHSWHQGCTRLDSWLLSVGPCLTSTGWTPGADPPTRVTAGPEPVRGAESINRRYASISRRTVDSSVLCTAVSGWFSITFLRKAARTSASVASGVTPSNRNASPLLPTILPQVESESLENQVSLAVSAVVERPDDPISTVADITYIAPGTIPTIELSSKRIQLARYVVVLFSDPPNSWSEPSRALCRNHCQQRTWLIQLSLLLRHGVLKRTQTRLQLLDPVLTAGSSTQGVLDCAHTDQGPVSLDLSCIERVLVGCFRILTHTRSQRQPPEGSSPGSIRSIVWHGETRSRKS
jgi:hypothetical protein